MNAFRFGWHLGVLEESAQVGELQVDRLREGVEQPPHLRGRMHRYYIDCLHTGRYHIDTHTFRYHIDRTYISIKCPATAFSKREASARRRPWRKGSGGAEAWGGLPLETRPPIRQSPCPHSEPESETDRWAGNSPRRAARRVARALAPSCSRSASGSAADLRRSQALGRPNPAQHPCPGPAEPGRLLGPSNRRGQPGHRGLFPPPDTPRRPAGSAVSNPGKESAFRGARNAAHGRPENTEQKDTFSCSRTPSPAQENTSFCSVTGP